jgi:hypothetical protein
MYGYGLRIGPGVCIAQSISMFSGATHVPIVAKNTTSTHTTIWRTMPLNGQANVTPALLLTKPRRFNHASTLQNNPRTIAHCGRCTSYRYRLGTGYRTFRLPIRGHTVKTLHLGRYAAYLHPKAGLIIQSTRKPGGIQMRPDHPQFAEWVDSIQTAIDVAEADALCKSLLS